MMARLYARKTTVQVYARCHVDLFKIPTIADSICFQSTFQICIHYSNNPCDNNNNKLKKQQKQRPHLNDSSVTFVLYAN